MTKLHLVAATVAAMALAGCATAHSEPAAPAVEFNKIESNSAAFGLTRPGFSLISGSEILERTSNGASLSVVGKTELEVSSPFGPYDSPMATKSTAHQATYYLGRSRTDDGSLAPTAQLRRKDAATGLEETLATGVTSMAVGPGDRLAFSRAVAEPAAGEAPRLTEVVVREPDGTEAVWSTVADRYLVIGWAGDRLIFHRWGSDGAQTDVFSATGPANQRLIGPDLSVVAISPDGRFLAVAGRAVGGGPSDGPTLSVLDVATGTVTGGLELADRQVRGVSGGSWSEFGLLLPAVLREGTGLLVLAVSTTGVKPALDVRTLLRFDGISMPSLFEPTWLAGGDSVVALASNGIIPRQDGSIPAQAHLFVACDLTSEQCQQTPVGIDRMTGRVRNPSAWPGMTLTTEER